ncbi:hypothetical protein [Weissella cibaria]|uniref:hypothetical protein n=1 Tax=Weissella cibaria TaxID=137591 RepID=UPI0007063153|nr:hypothetical protein [Weissella cibaria]ALI33932.1 hypothetical protein AO080_10980 [Weissella cibaria]
MHPDATIDTKITSKQVRRFFKDEAVFILNVSQFFQNNPKTTPDNLPIMALEHDNSHLDEMKNYANLIIMALNTVPTTERRIIWYRYVERLNLFDTAELVHIGDRQIQKYAQKGLVTFALAFQDTYDILAYVAG